MNAVIYNNQLDLILKNVTSEYCKNLEIINLLNNICYTEGVIDRATTKELKEFGFKSTTEGTSSIQQKGEEYYRINKVSGLFYISHFTKIDTMEKAIKFLDLPF